MNIDLKDNRQSDVSELHEKPVVYDTNLPADQVFTALNLLNDGGNSDDPLYVTMYRYLREQNIYKPGNKAFLLDPQSEKGRKVRDVAQKYFGMSWLASYTGNGSKECTDGSDIYTILNDEGKIYIAKVGCGEFNRNSFSKEGCKTKRPNLKLYDSPIPLFVVNQDESYFALVDPNSWPYKICSVDPRLYINAYAVLVSTEKGKAIYRDVYNCGNERPSTIERDKIHIPTYDEVIKLLSKN